MMNFARKWFTPHIDNPATRFRERTIRSISLIMFLVSGVLAFLPAQVYQGTTLLPLVVAFTLMGMGGSMLAIHFKHLSFSAWLFSLTWLFDAFLYLLLAGYYTRVTLPLFLLVFLFSTLVLPRNYLWILLAITSGLMVFIIPSQAASRNEFAIGVLADFILSLAVQTVGLYIFRLEFDSRLDAAEQARMRAEAADRVKTQFLSNISHELRTPLNAIIGYAELLVSEEILTKEERLIKQVEFNPKILANGVHLRGLVDDLLELARLEDQVVRITSDEVNPTHLITTVVSNQQGLTGGKPVTLEAICDPGLPKTAHWDQRRVTQILNNLIGNAVKFTDQGSVKVHAMPHPTIANHISIAVSDTGMGMPPDAVTYIFERFRQVDSSDERRHGGAGLGLSITKGLLDLLGGDVCVQSELGKGSTFTITLPTEIKPAIPTIKSDH